MRQRAKRQDEVIARMARSYRDDIAEASEAVRRTARTIRGYAERVDWLTGETELVHCLRSIADELEFGRGDDDEEGE